MSSGNRGSRGDRQGHGSPPGRRSRSARTARNGNSSFDLISAAHDAFRRANGPVCQRRRERVSASREQSGSFGRHGLELPADVGNIPHEGMGATIHRTSRSSHRLQEVGRVSESSTDQSSSPRVRTNVDGSGAPLAIPGLFHRVPCPCSSRRKELLS